MSAYDQYLYEQENLWPDIERRCDWCESGGHEECVGFRDVKKHLPCLCWHLGPPAEDGEPPLDEARVTAQFLAYKRHGVC